MTPPRETPAGCQEIPGYIVEIFKGSAWLTLGLGVTEEWSERGVWATQAEANAAMAALFNELAE